jgi:hypothetical protein
VPTDEFTRAQFLARAVAVGITGAAGTVAATTPAAATATAPTTVAGAAGPYRRGGLTYRGVCYEVGDGATPETSWNHARMHRDVGVIKTELHASTVSVYGDGVERLAATASAVADRGLHVWVQPRLGDCPEQEILDHLAETGRQAEQLRRQGARIHLSVGCEFVLYVPGIVPGADVLERVQNLLDGNFDRDRMNRLLRRFIARAATVGRSVFHGDLTYAAAQDDIVDWRLFDIVSIDYYAYFRRRADYLRDLAQYLRWQKPVAIAEFGTCTYAGAPQRGGMGWDVVDYDAQPERIIADLVRSERTQAAYLTDLLDVFESMNLYAATVYNFVTPDAPHRRNVHYDLDLASYGIVKPIWDSADDPGPRWHWQRKDAFRALAGHYRRVGC